MLILQSDPIHFFLYLLHHGWVGLWRGLFSGTDNDEYAADQCEHHKYGDEGAAEYGAEYGAYDECDAYFFGVDAESDGAEDNGEERKEQSSETEPYNGLGAFGFERAAASSNHECAACGEYAKDTRNERNDSTSSFHFRFSFLVVM